MLAQFLSQNILSGILGLIDKALPNKEQAEQLKAQLIAQEHQLVRQHLDSAAQTIQHEAKGESWLQRNWRPLTMLAFVVMLLSYWAGFAPENLSENDRHQLFAVVKIGLGGYLAGRSAEKIIKTIKQK